MDTNPGGARCPRCGAEMGDQAQGCPVCGLSTTVVLPRHSQVDGRLAPSAGGTQIVEWPAAEGLTHDGGARLTQAGGSAHSRGGQGLLEPGQMVGSRYRVIRLLGVGGMGAVYQAWDSELGVAVALKMIRPDVTADPAAAKALEHRFKQELLLARQVTHKNVVRIHDLGEIDGLKYISMPFIEGSDLASVLEEKGKLPVTTVMPIARQVAAGLLAAHEAGIVHRDLKPANIMIEGDRALITDFGIARSSAQQVSAAAVAARPEQPSAMFDASESTTHAADTMAGRVVGTIDYMAPEQARAEPVDHRADVYAFGLILYDMLLGLRRARRPDSAFDELARRMREAPPSPRSVAPEIPEPLDQVVMRCLQPAAAARYQTTADLVAALDRLDDSGRRVPLVRRLTPRLMATAALLVAALLAGTYFVAQKLVTPPAQHAPVSVLIADFQNSTGDLSFDRTLEPVVKLALEGAGFISAYDRAGIRRSLGVRPPEDLNERAATELAVKEGVNVVLAGAVAQQGGRYEVSVKAIEAVSGNVITTASERASRKEDLLSVATELAGTVREALGDTTSDSVRRFAMETLTTRSIDAVREYARGMDGFSRSQFDQAFRSFKKAAELDPEFGLAYGGMAIASRNLDRLQDAEKYANEAMQHVDGMTERERFRARGLYYSITGDYEACVKEYGDLIAQFSADAAARNNRATCLAFLRDLPKSVEEMKQVVRILPKRMLYRENLALYSAYSGDFRGAAEQVRGIAEPGLFAFLARAFSELGEGQRADAAKTYQTLPAVDDGEGPSYMASGLGDIAIHEGRYADAVRILSEGAAADEKAQNPDRAASKVIALAYAQLQRGRKADALAAAERAMALSPGVKIQFLAGRIFIDAGKAARAEQIAIDLGKSLKAEPQAYASILEGLRALSVGNNRLAVKSFTDANAVLNTWIGHFDLGRAYLAAGAFIQADSEFDRCLVRKGEALALFMDEEPTFGYFPPVLYYQGLVREGLKSVNHKDSYRAYLQIRGNSTEDPFVADARKRAGS